jgi:hypothetical protein
MRMLLIASICTETGNAGIRNGSLESGMQEMMKMLKPESAYFTTGDDGNRTAYVVFDLSDASQIVPSIEPFFLNLNAKVSLRPVMVAEDLGKGMAVLGKSMAAR